MTDSSIRRATDAVAADVAAMVGEIGAHEDQSAHVRVDEARWRMLLARPDAIVLLPERRGEPVATSPPSGSCICGQASAERREHPHDHLHTCDDQAGARGTPLAARDRHARRDELGAPDVERAIGLMRRVRPPAGS